MSSVVSPLKSSKQYENVPPQPTKLLRQYRTSEQQLPEDFLPLLQAMRPALRKLQLRQGRLNEDQRQWREEFSRRWIDRMMRDAVDLGLQTGYNPDAFNEIINDHIEAIVIREVEQPILLNMIEHGPETVTPPSPISLERLTTVYAWHPQQRFEHQWIGQALRAETRPVENLYGLGSRWLLNEDTPYPIELQVIPDRAVAVLRRTDDFAEPETRRFKLAELRVRDSQTNGEVLIFSATEDRGTLVTLTSRGDISERLARATGTPTLDDFMAVDSPPEREVVEPSTVSATEAAAIMGFTKPYVHRLVKQGKLPVVKTVGKAILLDEAAVRRFQRSRRPRS